MVAQRRRGRELVTEVVEDERAPLAQRGEWPTFTGVNTTAEAGLRQG
jgi:hypothetical protein